MSEGRGGVDSSFPGRMLSEEGGGGDWVGSGKIISEGAGGGGASVGGGGGVSEGSGGIFGDKGGVSEGGKGGGELANPSRLFSDGVWSGKGGDDGIWVGMIYKCVQSSIKYIKIL